MQLDSKRGPAWREGGGWEGGGGYIREGMQKVGEWEGGGGLSSHQPSATKLSPAHAPLKLCGPSVWCTSRSGAMHPNLLVKTGGYDGHIPAREARREEFPVKTCSTSTFLL